MNACTLAHTHTHTCARTRMHKKGSQGATVTVFKEIAPWVMGSSGASRGDQWAKLFCVFCRCMGLVKPRLQTNTSLTVHTVLFTATYLATARVG